MGRIDPITGAMAVAIVIALVGALALAIASAIYDAQHCLEHESHQESYLDSDTTCHQVGTSQMCNTTTTPRVRTVTRCVRWDTDPEPR